MEPREVAGGRLEEKFYAVMADIPYTIPLQSGFLLLLVAKTVINYMDVSIG